MFYYMYIATEHVFDMLISNYRFYYTIDFFSDVDKQIIGICSNAKQCNLHCHNIIDFLFHNERTRQI